MEKFSDFLNEFRLRSRHHSKLSNFIGPELINNDYSNILEFGLAKNVCPQNYF